MHEANLYLPIMALCGLILISYVFSAFSHRIKVPTALLLILTGVVLHSVLKYFGVAIDIPAVVIELLGVVGLIMIVLEAGLDLRFSRKKIGLIRSALLSSLFVLLLSSVGIALVLHARLGESWLKSIVYAIPLSVVSSAVVIPSSRILKEEKREFLTYESSFSDILGILLFDYFIAKGIFTLQSLGLLAGGILVAIILSVVMSLLLLWVLTHSRVNIKFFLMFATLLILYSAGQLLHLPSLLILLIFGLLINNWRKVPGEHARTWAPNRGLGEIVEPLKSLTRESSFMVRTFFFILFGYTIDLSGALNRNVLVVGCIIVLILYVVRYAYLRLFVEKHVVPELFYAPRGLVTILLFYKIPQGLQLTQFNDGIIFFVIITTSLIMMFGSIFFTSKNVTDPRALTT